VENVDRIAECWGGKADLRVSYGVSYAVQGGPEKSGYLLGGWF
jgi:hypothetical protein